MTEIEGILNRARKGTNYDGREYLEVSSESYLETDLQGRANNDALLNSSDFLKVVHDGKWHKAVGVFVDEIDSLTDAQFEELEELIITLEEYGILDDALYSEYREAELEDFVYNDMYQCLDWFPGYDPQAWIESLDFDDIRDHIMFEGDRPYVLDTIKELYDETLISV